MQVTSSFNQEPILLHMTDATKISKSSKIFCLMGSIFLVIMGAFHGSGFFFVSEAISKSNAEDFLKDIVPALFAHPSIHLFGIAGLGAFTLFLTQDFRKLTWAITILVFIDALLGFYLGGPIPGVLLTIAALCFFIAGYKNDH